MAAVFLAMTSVSACWKISKGREEWDLYLLWMRSLRRGWGSQGMGLGGNSLNRGGAVGELTDLERYLRRREDHIDFNCAVDLT